jgi:hypothetical protein
MNIVFLGLSDAQVLHRCYVHFSSYLVSKEMRELWGVKWNDVGKNMPWPILD